MASSGLTVERVPWGEGKEQLTTRYRWFLARWAKRLFWVAHERTEQSLRGFFTSLPAEVAQLRRDGYEPILTKARWCLLKRRENLTEHQEVRLKEILQYNLKSIRAHEKRSASARHKASKSRCFM